MLNIISSLLIIYKMQPKHSDLPSEPSPGALDLLQADQSIILIDNLNTHKIESLNNLPRQRLSQRLSADFQHSPFEDKLTLDIIIQKLLQNLIKTKIQLMELEEEGLIKETEGTKKFIPYFKDELKKYNKTLLLRETQLGSLIYVIENIDQPDFEQKYLSSYGFLGKFIISLQQSKKPISIVSLEQASQVEIEFLQQYADMITLIKLNIVHKKYITDVESLIRISNRLKIINSKIASIAQMFPYACVLDKNDLFSYKKTSLRWHYLLEHSIKYKIYGSKQAVNRSFANLKNGLNFVNATMSIMHQTRSSWLGTAKDIRKDLANLAQSTSKILKCLIFKQHAHHEAEVLISDPNSGLAKQIWNLPEQKMFKNLIASVLPSIAFSHEFWIPRLFSDFLQKNGEIELPEVSILDIGDYLKKLHDGSDRKDKIQMRINSPFILHEKIKKEETNLKSILGVLVKSFVHHQVQDHPTAVIFHIHGGGFISMSSFIHQTYTRIWANNLKVPIISVDYGKAPQFPYPQGLHDCFQAYMWTLYCYRQIYEAEPLKIILVGDSAGGNLVAALTNMLIKLKLRAPDGLVLVYPALNLSRDAYTPSLLTSLNDLILPHTFLKICLKAYLKEDVDPNSNEFVSPICASQQILKRYPPTRIFVGSKDPFHDDCCRFTQKLNKYDQNKAKLMIFEEFPHGFLQFDIKTQPHEECRKATKEVQNAIGELLSLIP